MAKAKTAKKKTTSKAATKSTKVKKTAAKSSSSSKSAQTTKSSTKSSKKSSKKKAPVERRAAAESDRRQTGDRRQKTMEVADDRRQIERRQKVNRRRQIDPTTCERDYSDAEVEFMQALDEYKRKSGRMFPTCSEILEVIAELGYVKQDAAGASAVPVAVAAPTAEVADETSQRESATLPL